MNTDAQKQRRHAARTITSILLSGLLAVPVCWVRNASAQTISGVSPSDVVRGGLVTVSGTGFPTDSSKISVTLTAVGVKCSGCAAPARTSDQIHFSVSTNTSTPCPPAGHCPELTEVEDVKVFNASSTSFTFAVPADVQACTQTVFLALGRYTGQVTFTSEDGKSRATLPLRLPSQNNQLLLISSSGNEVKITAISPLVGYPEDDETYGITVLGQGFSNVAQDNILIVQNRGTIPVKWIDSYDPSQKGSPFGVVISSGELIFWGIPKQPNAPGAIAHSYQGKLNLQIQVGDNISSPASTTFSMVSYYTPLGVAVAFIFVTGLVLLYLVNSGVREYRVADQTYDLVRAFFIDPETDTYSLSKFQFYWWTAIAIFSYVYLTVARSLVQGAFEFSAIPSGLPGIVLISASTKVLAVGITGAKGPKGAGNIQPSFSDFVTTGGIVTAERAQFLVWTLVGGLGFLFLTLLRDPGNIQDLPQLPNGFLELMGISSFGYLGGKFARKPGPVIDEIVASPGSLNLEIHGRFLSKDASFQIGEDPITSDTLAMAPPNPTDKDDQTQEPGMYKILRLKVTNPTKEGEWAKDKHNLTITNPDGQKAVWPFEVKKPAQQVTTQVAIAIDPPAQTVKTSSMLQLKATVTGTSNTNVKWSTDPSGATTGSVDQNGLYSAPAAVPSPPTVKIVATSAADSSRSATATITITQ